MPINSFNFWLVFPFIFLIYWLIPDRYQQVRKLWLLVLSWLLYIAYKPAFALVLLYVITVTYTGALLLSKFHDDLSRKKRKWTLGFIFTVLSVAPLLIFKYYNFVNDSVAAALGAVGLNFSLPGLNWAIPIGLSFFTFQAMSYLFDVYRGSFAAEKNFLDYSLFVSFFPQIAAGPISKAGELLPQIKNLGPFNTKCANEGLRLLLWGMFLKVVIADRLGMFVDAVYANHLSFSGSTCMLASVFYTIQIYGDFAGYSLMAIGLAKTLGITLVTNFCRPYLAVSISDFWKRWHISLTRWLTQNIYIPLGGSRCSRMRCYMNILITFLVSGIWHGAAWTFIVWGLIHGLFQIFEKLTGIRGSDNLPIRVLQIMITFVLVTLGWVFFRSPDFSTAFSIIRHYFSGGAISFSLFGRAVTVALMLSLAILMFKEVREEFFPNKFAFLERRVVKWCIYITIFCIILLCGVLDGGQFIYASF